MRHTGKKGQEDAMGKREKCTGRVLCEAQRQVRDRELRIKIIVGKWYKRGCKVRYYY